MKFKLVPFLFSLAFGFCLLSCSNQASQAQSTPEPPEDRQGPPPNEQGPPSGVEPGERGARPKGPPNFARILKDLDKNEDGKISKEEAAGPLKNDFSRIDTNEDGLIDEEEFKAGAPKPPRRN
ncbi:MAG: EF-hand domain-containing protein [Bacteroidota bacterium]